MVAAVCCPAGTKTLGVIVATLVLLLVKVTVVPPGGAAVARLSARLTIWPGATAGAAARLTCAEVPVTCAVPVW